MSPQTDIIRIAKELDAKCDGDGSYLAEEIANARIETVLLDALLLAVTGLQMIERVDPEFRPEEIASGVLAKIRSLPTA